jgi:drug/metabolite transporter (DMT)-like permease
MSRLAGSGWFAKTKRGIDLTRKQSMLPTRAAALPVGFHKAPSIDVSARPPPMTPATQRFAAVLALVFNALVWGVSWWPLRRLDAVGLHSLWATALICALAMTLVTLWRPSAWRDLASAPGLWLLAFSSGITNAAFNWGVTIGEVVRVVLLFYLMPAWAVLLAAAMLRERATVAALARTALALLGAAVVLYPDGGGWPVPHSLADWLGMLGGLGFALTNVTLRREAHQPDAARALAMFAGGIAVPAGIAVLLAARGTIGWVPTPEPGWIAGLLALALAFLGGNLALQYGAARLPASVTAVVLITEVFFASVSAVWLGEEALTLRKVVGGALILAAALLASLPPRRTSPMPAAPP